MRETFFLIKDDTWAMIPLSHLGSIARSEEHLITVSGERSRRLPIVSLMGRLSVYKVLWLADLELRIDHSFTI